MKGQRSQPLAVGLQAPLLVQVEEQLGVADHRVSRPELGVFVLDDVEAVGAAGENPPGFVPVEGLHILLDQHLGKVFVAGPPGHVPVAGLFGSQNGKIHPGALQHPRHSLGNLPAPVVEGSGATHEPEQLGFGVVAHQGHIQPLAPVRPAVGAESPGVGLVLQVGEGLLNLGWEAGFHEHLVLSGLDDKIQMFDVHRADVLTGPAGGAGPEHVAGHRGTVAHDGLNRLNVAAQNGVGLGQQVHLEVMDDLFGRKGLVRVGCRALLLAAAALGAGIQVEHILPVQFTDPAQAEGLQFLVFDVGFDDGLFAHQRL